MKTRFAARIVIAFLVASVTASAQQGMLSGTVVVRDSISGAGAVVEILGTDRIGIADEDGSYIIPRVRPGAYSVQVIHKRSGLRRIIDDIMIRFRDTTRLDITLENSDTVEGVSLVTLDDKQSRFPAVRLHISQIGLLRRDSGSRPLEDPWSIRPADNPFIETEARVRSGIPLRSGHAAYSEIRATLDMNVPPRPATVRIEELVNAFPYRYPEPDPGHAFRFNSEVAVCPWDTTHIIARIALQGTSMADELVPPRNVVLLVDVSRSMEFKERLALLQQACTTLVDRLRPTDRIAIVTYNGRNGIALQPTSGADREGILAAIRTLHWGSPVNGRIPLRTAYDLVRQNFSAEATNRVILVTDGEIRFTSSEAEFLQSIAAERRAEISTHVLGAGAVGYYQLALCSEIARVGNGRYWNVDRSAEYEQALDEMIFRPTITTADPGELEISFNPVRVRSYRLIGYESRLLPSQISEEKTDVLRAIPSGYQMTALYEIEPLGRGIGFTVDRRNPDRDIIDTGLPVQFDWGDLLAVQLQYDIAGTNRQRIIRHVIPDDRRTPDRTSDDMRFAMAVASWGLVLRDSRYMGSATFELSRELALGSLGDDPEGVRREFVDLIERCIVIRERMESMR